MTEKLRIGVLTNRPHFRAWECRLLTRIAQSDYGELVVILIDQTLSSSVELRGPYLSRADSAITRLLQRASEFLERKFSCDPDALSCVCDMGLLDAIRRVPLTGIHEGQLAHFDEPDVERIKRSRLDVLICLTRSICRGEVLRSAKYGVWALHHGDGRSNPQRPVGFWEVYFDRPTIESTLHILAADHGPPQVIARSFSATNRLSVKLTNNKLYWKTLSLLSRKLAELHRLGEASFFANVGRDANGATTIREPSLGAPSNAQLAIHIARNVLRRLKESLLERFTLEQWILLFDLNKARSSDLSLFKRIVPPLDRYWADPHIVRRNENYYVFIEEITFASNKGHISVLALDEAGRYQAPVVVLKRDYHLSYPFVCEHAGVAFMIPESSANRTIELYRCVDFPERWEFVENLLEDVYAVDSTVIYHDKKWWLFTNIVENPGASSHEELFVFYSNSLVGGNWQPHLRNPIVSDARRARPAGSIFREDGKLLRPSQDCSIRYGYGIRVNHITQLSEDSYDERQVAFIEPARNMRIFATHTLARVPGLTVVDGLQRRMKLSQYG